MRWEKTTRPFLRTSEFLLAGGPHHPRQRPRRPQEETLLMLDVYRDFAENVLAMPVLTGPQDRQGKVRRRARHLFHGGDDAGRQGLAGRHHATTSAPTSAEAYDIQFLSKEGKLEYAHETSWGTSTAADRRHHHDPRRRARPEAAAARGAHPGGHPPHRHAQGRRAGDAPSALKAELEAAGLRVELDDRDTYSAGWKFNEWEMKGVPVRLELGPRDIENGVAMSMRRDTLEKKPLAAGRHRRYRQGAA